MSAPITRTPARALEARLRTGGAAHLLGGALDLAGAFARYLVMRVQAGSKRRAATRSGRDVPGSRSGCVEDP